MSGGRTLLRCLHRRSRAFVGIRLKCHFSLRMRSRLRSVAVRLTPIPLPWMQPQPVVMQACERIVVILRSVAFAIRNIFFMASAICCACCGCCAFLGDRGR